MAKYRHHQTAIHGRTQLVIMFVNAGPILEPPGEIPLKKKIPSHNWTKWSWGLGTQDVVLEKCSVYG